MKTSAIAIYVSHAIFWGSFLAGRWLNKRATATGAPSNDTATQARGANALVTAHMVGFFLLYFGIPDTLFAERAMVFTPLPFLGAALILAGAALAVWSTAVFRSWRFAAKLDAGHELCTRGPFAIVRHPIYTALDLLALGSFLWLPSILLACAFVAVAFVSDLRGRTEEKLLLATFGDRYRDYLARVRRFVPFVY